MLAAGLISGCGDSKLPLENTTQDNSTVRLSAATPAGGYYGNFVAVPQVTVTDRSGAPLQSVAVTFTAGGGGVVTGAHGVTDAAGQVSPTSWRLGARGAQSLTVSAPGARDLTLSASASAAPSSSFTIKIVYAAGTTPTAAQQDAFDNAVARWTRIILAGGAPYPVNEIVTGCGDIRGQTIDGVVIIADLKPIDGAGKVLGSAGPCILRDAGYLPVQGMMQFDTADLAQLEAQGQLDEVILHEMGHVLGFGTIWEVSAGNGLPPSVLLVRVPPEDPVFSGGWSREALFGLAGPAGFTGNPVPVEATGGPGTAFSHWRESTFGSELMTGWLNPGVNPLSALTIEQFRDLGYTVNDALGESYSFAALLQADVQGPVVLNEAPITLPLLVIDKTGRAVGRLTRVFK